MVAQCARSEKLWCPILTRNPRRRHISPSEGFEAVLFQSQSVNPRLTPLGYDTALAGLGEHFAPRGCRCIGHVPEVGGPNRGPPGRPTNLPMLKFVIYQKSRNSHNHIPDAIPKQGIYDRHIIGETKTAGPFVSSVRVVISRLCDVTFYCYWTYVLLLHARQDRFKIELQVAN